MDLHFYLWLAMTICAVILLYLNRQKSAIINQKNAIIKGYEEMVKKNGQINTRIAETSSDKTDQHQAIIDGLEKDWKEMSGLVDDYKKKLEKQQKENAVLRKQAAEYIPMKSLDDYKEKVCLLTEQAEDMFGLYIDKVTMTRYIGMFNRSWKIDMEINTIDIQQKPKDNIDKQSANTAE